MKAVLFPNIVGYHSVSMVRYANELAQGLAAPARERGWDVESVSCRPPGRLARGGPRARQWASRLGRMVTYPLLAARQRGDVFHVLDHSHANLALALPPRRTVLTCHDIIPLLAARGEIAVPVPRLHRLTFPPRLAMMRRCARVIAISESTKRDLVRLAGISPDRIDVVYYGVNPSFAPLSGGPEAREAERADVLGGYGLPAEAKIILHVGTKGRYKNTPALLHALALLAASGVDARLLRVGAPFYDEEAALVGTLGLAGRVVHAGPVYDDALLAAHYRAADMFAFPSLYEGFGWPPLEAMACGTPVVTSDAASLPEFVGGGAGLMAPAHDHEALARAMQSVLTDDSLHAALRAAGLARAAQFTWDATGRNTLSVYERVAAGNSSVSSASGKDTP